MSTQNFSIGVIVCIPFLKLFETVYRQKNGDNTKKCSRKIKEKLWVWINEAVLLKFIAKDYVHSFDQVNFAKNL